MVSPLHRALSSIVFCIDCARVPCHDLPPSLQSLMFHLVGFFSPPLTCTEARPTPHPLEVMHTQEARSTPHLQGAMHTHGARPTPHPMGKQCLDMKQGLVTNFLFMFSMSIALLVYLLACVANLYLYDV